MGGIAAGCAVGINTAGLVGLIEERVILLVIGRWVGRNRGFLRNVNPIGIFSRVSGISDVLYDYFLLLVLCGRKRKELWFSRAGRWAVRRIWARFTTMADMDF